MQLVREDWKLFRNIETLCQKAGVHRQFIPQLVVKELVDNALDATGDCKLELVDHRSFRVTDYGDGIDPEWLQEYFSINRPMISSKLLRLPSRGALGNGLRVVTGAVIATGGGLTVTTRGEVYKIIPLDDGTSVKELIGVSEHMGTSVLVQLGMSISESTLRWGNLAITFSKQGTMYTGKSSPYWYTSEAFFELINAANMTLEQFIPLFCGSKKSTEIIQCLQNYYGVHWIRTNDFSFKDAESLLECMREYIKVPASKALGEVGDCFTDAEHCKKTGTFMINSERGHCEAQIPIVVEAWASIKKGDNKRSSLTICVNKSPVTADVNVYTKQASTTMWGGGLHIEVKSRPADFYVNIITPYMPITSDGKAPDFRPMSDEIELAIKRAVSKARKANQDELTGGRNERQIVLDNLPAAIAKTSGNGSFIFSQRQLYYAIRPYIMDAFDGKQPNYTYFCQIITDYETIYGDIPGMYRDPRGTLYHPHTGEEIPLGTIAVQDYNRPKWTFNKIIFIEKEGYFASLRDVGFPEKYDCALLSSKGYASRAVKDLFDLLGETDEEIQFFCVHDADAAGTKIFETLQEATNARPGRKVKVINLGLDPEEACEMGLQIETFDSERRRPVANYVSYYWSDWLQSNRVELNAMSTPHFIEWLESKMEEHGVGKVIPTDDVLTKALEESTEQLIRSQVMNEILQQNDFERLVQQELSHSKEIIEHVKKDLRRKVSTKLELKPLNRWDAPINEMAIDLISNNTW
ncbi:ATP-binding protein [Paenibacillus alvei]|uniref:ATP-binding protein n=1 Tax=Paenibacillus alvei TaxID=44250 RepID=A0ABT4H3F8_PAEAL|nr:ATP-binding protein [Paenibacillus alvei]MCY9763191.1 ATP-binding protein [Paenibacillus alvei]MCY9769520.1 ATP-binding protein [Paenibacillus alvei]